MTTSALKIFGISSALVLTLAACGGDTDFDTPGGSKPTTAIDPSESVPPHDRQDADENGSNDDGENNGETSGSEDATPADIDLASEQTPITAADALDISAKEVGGGSEAVVHAIELEFETGPNVWQWTIETLVGDTDHEVKVNADTGDVMEHEKDSTDDQEKAIDLDSPMSFSKAKDLALSARDGRIMGWKYAWDDNRYQYEFDIEVDGEEEDVTVNAETGETEID